jgi:histidinol-phosphate aminotransferase
MRLFIEPGDLIVNFPPTFGMYSFDADINGAGVINICRRPDFSIPIDEVELVFIPPPHRDSQTGLPKLIIVTSPNNPDGSMLPDRDLERLLALPAIVMLDEAYIEFSGHSRIQWVKEHPNLIVLRTFSKWAGLAGVRVGYGAFPLDIIQHLWKIKQPYNVPVTGQIAAQVSLADRERLLERVSQIVQTRQSFYAKLAQFDWLEPYPSQANFILCQVVGGRRAIDIKEQLLEQGILARYYNSPGLTDHLRFSIGTPDQMTRLEQALQQL